MIFDTDGGCYVATKKTDWDGWRILRVTQFKEGAKVVECSRADRTKIEFRTVYCFDEVAPDVI